MNSSTEKTSRDIIIKELREKTFGNVLGGTFSVIILCQSIYIWRLESAIGELSIIPLHVSLPIYISMTYLGLLTLSSVYFIFDEGGDVVRSYEAFQNRRWGRFMNMLFRKFIPREIIR